MNPSGKQLLNSSDSNKTVRFYYGEHTGERFKAVAFDDYEDIEADLHEEHLIKNDVDYLRIEL